MTNLATVIDASIALAWAFRDELTEQALAIRQRVITAGAVVPAHWVIEVQAALRVGERRGRILATELAAFVQSVRQQPIEIDARPLAAFGELLALARGHGLSVSDAAYVELAMRRGLPLATKDDQMRRAAHTLGIELLDAG